ncbi:MAG: hypothetical protein EZS28_018964 [Streblomastix strix]|uniref:Protein kinase domain-containing protein n=1 Tax=Streblomastix strix TaxID=222440 RepID=A0A5J4VSU9_9EUKA|nr:MAG: hypothetical protein EZS28_018964 [Streblomastix strix]
MYMAPEVFKDGKMRIQSDIYSVGIMIYEMITGQHPFYRKEQQKQETVAKIMAGETNKLPDWVPSDMRDIVMNMMNVV